MIPSPAKNNLFVFYMIKAKKDSVNGTNSKHRNSFLGIQINGI